jgi:hypothetical protein
VHSVREGLRSVHCQSILFLAKSSSPSVKFEIVHRCVQIDTAPILAKSAGIGLPALGAWEEVSGDGHLRLFVELMRLGGLRRPSSELAGYCLSSLRDGVCGVDCKSPLLAKCARNGAPIQLYSRERRYGRDVFRGSIKAFGQRLVCA